MPHNLLFALKAIVGNGELDIAEISLADMDPEEIRTELRRAYTQLEVRYTTDRIVFLCCMYVIISIKQKNIFCLDICRIII